MADLFFPSHFPAVRNDLHHLHYHDVDVKKKKNTKTSWRKAIGIFRRPTGINKIFAPRIKYLFRGGEKI